MAADFSAKLVFLSGITFVESFIMTVLYACGGPVQCHVHAWWIYFACTVARGAMHDFLRGRPCTALCEDVYLQVGRYHIADAAALRHLVSFDVDSLPALSSWVRMSRSSAS